MKTLSKLSAPSRAVITVAPVPDAPPIAPAEPSEQVDQFVDPTGLQGLYALIGDGKCLEPDIPDGARLMFDTRASYAAGDLVALWFRPDAVKAGTRQALVKRLVSMPAFAKIPWEAAGSCCPVVMVEQLNPARVFYYPADHLLAVHRCMGLVPRETKSIKMKLPPWKGIGRGVGALSVAPIVEAATTLPAGEARHG